MQDSEKVLKYKVYKSINELNDGDKKLVEKAMKATENSYAPYSNFQVGACIELENGELFTGCNQENAVYPLSLCAERVTVFFANAQFPDIAVKTIAVAAQTKGNFTKSPVPPCGSCRQVLAEVEGRYNKPMKVLLYGDDEIYELDSASSLLPVTFNKKFL